MKCLNIRIPLFALIALAFALLAGLGGCRGARGPYSPPAEAARDPLEAQRLTLRAADLLEHDPDAKKLAQAEKLLREALEADLYHGPAHNDLGVLHLKQGRLYEAASEFEWARRTMPGHPDPRMNLALTLEKAGRYDEALKTYATALDVYPGHIPTIQAMTRLEFRHGTPGDKAMERLRTIALEGDSPAWRSWAASRLQSVP